MTNRLKERLKAGKKSFGVWTLGLSTVITETLAAAGYDFLFLDQEHGPQGLMETIRICRRWPPTTARRWSACRGTTRST